MSEGFMSGVAALSAQCKQMDQTQRFADTTVGSLPSLGGISRQVTCGVSESSESESVSREMSQEDLHHSMEVQEAVDAMAFEEVLGMQCAVFVADPILPNSPLVACSASFDKSTRHTLEDVIGRSCQFSLHRLEEKEQFVTMGEGETLYAQTSTGEEGELLTDMFYLKTVELDDRPFIVGLRASFEEGFDEKGLDGAKLCSLNASMELVEQKLASHFWYSSSMRRQN